MSEKPNREICGQCSQYVRASSGGNRRIYQASCPFARFHGRLMQRLYLGCWRNSKTSRPDEKLLKKLWRKENKRAEAELAERQRRNPERRCRYKFPHTRPPKMQTAVDEWFWRRGGKVFLKRYFDFAVPTDCPYFMEQVLLNGSRKQKRS